MTRKICILGLALALCLGTLSGCVTPTVTPPNPTTTPTTQPTQTTPVQTEKTQVRFSVLKGPSGVGAAYLMSQDETEKTVNDYEISIAAQNDEITAGLINGTIDIAAVASNVASNLYHKTGGDVQVAAVSGLGVLYLLENGTSIQSVADLSGKTVYATGQGANPEYVLNHLLTENGVDLKTMDIQWKTAEEVSALMASGDGKICMLPVPAATAVLAKNKDVRQALDFTEEWDALKNGSKLTMTTIVVRRAFAEAQPEALEAFLTEYSLSVSFMTAASSANIVTMPTPAQLVVKYGFAPNEDIALAAIPQCNLVCITGVSAMREAVQGYYEVLFGANPASIGGSIPDDAFYYGK